MYLVKDFKKILKDLEPFVTRADKKGRLWLHNGNNEKRKMDAIKVKDGTLFKLRPREAWANWLICVVLQHITGDEITFSDSEHGDGYIWNKTKGEVIITEHVAAMDFPNTTIPTGEERVIWAIEKKIKKGKEYAQGKHLVVFMDGAGKWYPTKVGRQTSGKHNFESIFCVGLITGDESGYKYGLTQFFPSHSPCWEIQINSDFTDWTITQIQ